MKTKTMIFSLGLLFLFSMLTLPSCKKERKSLLQFQQPMCRFFGYINHFDRS